eukprot:CAMPEP_0170077608 /NCGR_PEP_ID=MMETSP0019_2-20121128/14389_1 /TAXON_ID=98059 /ORGANISM="Dinobryon sp., Strain UTEXLB2267" /LENGTH=266 /DNA_ID=CAMNT_0010290035 /DNA_START=27 /DNA_END=827 /DNA_ORIENTATION=+
MSGNGNCLLIIDAQNDFHFGGSLAVPGADEDAQRVAKFIRKNSAHIHTIVETMDSHNIEHIAHANVWRDKNNKEPAAFTEIHHNDIGTLWFPKNSYYIQYCKDYTQSLEKTNRFKLTVWPQHCIIGTHGHKIVKCIQDEVDRWAEADPSHNVDIVMKGMNNFTEMYSAFEAEVPVPTDCQTGTNHALLEKLKSHDKVFVCGQASSHCVNYTVKDLVKYWDRRYLSNIVYLIDGSSPVEGYKRNADKFIEEIKEAGVTIATCDTVIA